MWLISMVTICSIGCYLCRIPWPCCITFAVIALTPKRRRHTGAKAIKVIAKSITKNPLIIAIFLRSSSMHFQFPFQKWWLTLGNTLPIWLCLGSALCTGGLQILVRSNKKSCLRGSPLAGPVNCLTATNYIGCLVLRFEGLDLGLSSDERSTNGSG